MEISRELSQVLDGLLEPVVEDRMSAADAMAVLGGRSISTPAGQGTPAHCESFAHALQQLQEQAQSDLKQVGVSATRRSCEAERKERQSAH